MSAAAAPSEKNFYRVFLCIETVETIHVSNIGKPSATRQCTRETKRNFGVVYHQIFCTFEVSLPCTYVQWKWKYYT